MNRFTHDLKRYQTSFQRFVMNEHSTSLIVALLLALTLSIVFYPLVRSLLASDPAQQKVPASSKTAQMARVMSIAQQPALVFDPTVGAVLPTHRVIAFYAVPHAEATGPAFELTRTMLSDLKKQGTQYQRLDPAHPVQLAIDLVVSVPDPDPGPLGWYSHHVDADTIQSYVNFCQQNGLVLFLDLNFGWAPVASEVNFFLPYLEHYSFVHLAIDPEWMFPRHDGIPGTNLSNIRASDLNPIIRTLAALPMLYHVPRKMLLIHQYRSDGDGLKNPYDAGLAEFADKHNLLSDPNVDVVIHIDSVGGYVGDKADKILEYNNWVTKDIQKYGNFQYGGFKLFYHIEAQTGVMTPQEVLTLNPAPMIVSYGN